MNDPVHFVLAVLTLLGTPGPTNTLLATAGAMLGLRRALPLLAGELVGYAGAILAIRLVLAPILGSYPALGAALKVAVAAFLVFTAVRMWRSNGINRREASISLGDVLVTTLLNPKAAVLAIGVFPTHSDHMLMLVGLFGLIVPAVGLCWILLGQAISTTTGRARQGLLKRIASGALLVFAGLIAVTAFG
jgi:threonine/homoserine/homoserine lactone efflux protein